MKNIVIGLAMAATTLTACENSSTKSTETKTKNSDSIPSSQTEQLYSCPMHPEVTGKKGDKCPKCEMELSVPIKSTSGTNQTETTTTTGDQSSINVSEVISNYLKVKNALTKDNGKGAAEAANAIVAAIAKYDASGLSAAQKKAYDEIADDAKEHAEHIGANAGKLDHQREHFELLSKDVLDLVKTYDNGGQTLYKVFCPMYNNNKGAFWLSETKEIKNPYLGKAMPTCGTIKEEIK